MRVVNVVHDGLPSAGALGEAAGDGEERGTKREDSEDRDFTTEEETKEREQRYGSMVGLFYSAGQ